MQFERGGLERRFGQPFPKARIATIKRLIEKVAPGGLGYLAVTKAFVREGFEGEKR
jgi:hypothetical protein